MKTLIKGDIITFKKGTYTRDKNPMSGDEVFVVSEIPISAWIRWDDGEVAETRVVDASGRPERDELGHDDTSKWPLAFGGNGVQDPWSLVQYVYLFDRKTAGSATFVGPSTGAEIACGKLRDSMQNMRRFSAPGACPVVKLSMVIWPTKRFGNVPRPHFQIIDWIGGGPPSETLPAPPTPPAPVALPAPTPTTAEKTTPARRPRALIDDLDDEIPFN
jgi:hypothetical protein